MAEEVIESEMPVEIQYRGIVYRGKYAVIADGDVRIVRVDSTYGSRSDGAGRGDAYSSFAKNLLEEIVSASLKNKGPVDQ